MLTVKYERYWNDFFRKNEERSFCHLAELEEWMFGQMKQNYSGDTYTMSFPTPEKAKRIGETGPWNIEFKPERGGETIWIHQIKSERGIVFSDGKYTSGQKHWSAEVKDWLRRCEERRKAPKFDFAE